MVKKCAKLTECDEIGKEVIYNAKACDGDEKFNYLGSVKELGDTCQIDHLVQVDYDSEYCSENHFCQVDYMELATDNLCEAECSGW